MSDREDVENIGLEVSSQTENPSSEKINKEEENEIYSTKRKITHTIRQNPLAHMGERSDKPTLLEKLKRAFSTEDTYSGGFIADDEPENGGYLDDADDIFSGLISRFKANKDKTAVPVEIGVEEKVENSEKTEETEKTEKTEIYQEEDDKAPTDTELDDDDNIDEEIAEQLAVLGVVLDDVSSVAEENEKDYDEESALEESDFKFIFAADDGEAAEFSEDEDEDEDKTAVTEDEVPEVNFRYELENSKAAPKSSENKVEESTETVKAEENSEQIIIENRPEAIVGEDQEVSESKVEESTETVKAEENSEQIIIKNRPEAIVEENAEVSESKVEESTETVKAEENSEQIIIENQPEAIVEENAEVSESKVEDTTETVKAEEVPEQIIIENQPEVIVEENAEVSENKVEDTTETVKAEENSEQIIIENRPEVIVEENAEVSESKVEELTETVKAEENKQEKEETSEVKVEISNKEKSEQSAENQPEEIKTNDSKLARFKGFLNKTKNKLIEMWNEKLPEEEAASKTVEKSDSDGEFLAAELVESPRREETSAAEGTEKTVPESDEEMSNTAVLYVNEGAQSISSDETAQILDKTGSSEDQPAEKQNNVQIKVIKSSTNATTEIDTAKLRESLNVITPDKSDRSVEDKDESFEILLEEPDILKEKPKEEISEENVEIIENVEVPEDIPEEERLQQEANRKVLDKVKKCEEWITSQKENTNRESAERSAKAYEKEFGEVKPITEVDITDYITPGQHDEIKVKAGKFAESVRCEYEFYIGYKRLQNVAKNQSRIDHVNKTINESSFSEEENPAESKTKTRSVRTKKSASDRFAKSRDRLYRSSQDLDAMDRENPDALEYRSEEDEAKVKRFVTGDYKKSKNCFTLTVFLMAVTFLLFCFGGKFAATAAEVAAGGTGSERLFVLINLVLFAIAVFFNREMLIDGLRPLKRLKASPDTSISLACAAAALQSLIALIAPTFFFSQSLNIYTLLAMLSLTINSYGRYVTAKRANANLKFVLGSFNKYTAKFYHDQRMSAKMLSGTAIEKSEIVFQKRTSFLKHFIKLTYAPDPGDDLSVKFAIPATVFSVIISIIYAVVWKNFLGTISVLSVMLCMAVPVCAKVLSALPVYQLSKSTLRNQAMVVGYPAVEHFSESGAIMIDAKELYPEGSVHMNGIKTFGGRRIDDALLAAAAVMVNAGGAMAGMFDGIIQGNKEDVLPPVESVIYEDGKGLIGWVNRERILVGNRELLEEHGIEPMSEEYEDKYRKDGNEIMYLASAGELMAMFIIGYSANRRVMDVLRRMESNGMCFLIRTVDVNITPERISKDFGIYCKRIKILPTGMGNVIRDEMIGKEKNSPAYIATKGGVTPLGRAVSGCIKTKKNISLSIAIQIIAVLLGLLLVTTIVLFAEVQQVGAMELFLFSLFWCAAVMIAPIIQKS